MDASLVFDPARQFHWAGLSSSPVLGSEQLTGAVPD